MKEASNDLIALEDDRIEERRRKVQSFILRGLSQGTIAKLLKVHRITIVRDVSAIREYNRKRVEEAQIDVMSEIGEQLSYLDEFQRMALLEFHSAEEGSKSRGSFLSIALRASEQRTKFLLDTGVIPRATTEISEISEVLGVADLSKVDSEVLRMKAVELVQKIDPSIVGGKENRELRKVEAREVKPTNGKKAGKKSPKKKGQNKRRGIRFGGGSKRARAERKRV